MEADQRNATVEGVGDSPRTELQPEVSPSDLSEFETTPEARHLARLEADTELMLRLSADGFEGRVWEKVAGALVEYGFAVMRAWLITGQVFVKLREKGRGGLDPPPAGVPRDEAITLADEAVADGIVHFRDNVLKTGYWDPRRGASLSTFFVGNCLLIQFPNLYRKWFRDRRRRLTYMPIEPVGSGATDHPALQIPAKEDPQRDVVERDTSARAVRSILSPVADETNRAILALRADGYGIDEIGEILDLSYKQVEGRIYRARQAVRRSREEQ